MVTVERLAAARIYCDLAHLALDEGATAEARVYVDAALALTEAVLCGERAEVVIDPENSEHVEMLARALKKQGILDTGMNEWRVASALRSLVADRKPDEPQGLGAVVEDTRGRKWLRVDWVNPWCLAKPLARDPRQEAAFVKWHDIPVGRVLREGWSE